MAELTTTTGVHYFFKPDAVIAVSDHDRTCILGLTSGVIQIAEPVRTFLDRIGKGPEFVQLSQGVSSVWMSARAVSIVRAPLPGEFAGGVRAVVIAGPVTQGIHEDPAATRTKIAAAGGTL
jgi:hypothetical protein